MVDIDENLYDWKSVINCIIHSYTKNVFFFVLGYGLPFFVDGYEL